MLRKYEKDCVNQSKSNQAMLIFFQKKLLRKEGVLKAHLGSAYRVKNVEIAV
jgi:hypothetical protein